MIALLRRVREIAERQAEVALAVDPAELDVLTAARSDLLFELQVAMRGGAIESFEREEARGICEAIRAADRRTELAAAIVLGVTSQAAQSSTPTYGRHGRVR